MPAMSIEAGSQDPQERFSEQSRRVLSDMGYSFHGLEGRVLAGTIRKYEEKGLSFAKTSWLGEDSGLLLGKSTYGEIAINLRSSPVVFKGRKISEHDQGFRDLTSEIQPPQAQIKRGSLSDSLEIILQFYEKNERFPEFIKDNPETYLVTSTREGLLLAVGDFLSPKGIQLKTVNEAEANEIYMSLPLVYPGKQGFVW